MSFEKNERTPSITAKAIVDHLASKGILDEKGLISILGNSRNSISLNKLELALVRNNIISAENLAQIVEELSGVRTYQPNDVRVSTQLPLDIVRAYGVLLVEGQDPFKVLFVEDTAKNVEAINEFASGQSYEIGLVTASHFVQMFTAAYSGKEYHSMPLAADLYEVLDAAIEARATDLHLKVGVQPRVRTDGRVKELDFRPLDKTWMLAQVDKLVEPRHVEDLKKKFSTDLAYSYGTARFRINIAHDSHGPTMALRQLPSKIPTPDEISLPEAVRQFADLERGMVLVTGPTGSGKSTTLAAVLYEIVMKSDRHVITLEDPIEFQLPVDGPSQVNQRELGASFASFPDGLRDALRQDPDVVLVGELRDAETIKTAITAAETGHLVLGTLHTYDAPSTVMRLVNAFPADEQSAVRAQLSQLLRGIVSQTLIPKAAGKGRVAGFELLLNTPSIATNLRKEDGHNQLKQTMQTSAKVGMQTMEMALARLVFEGVISDAEARFRARDLGEYERNREHLNTQQSI